MSLNWLEKMKNIATFYLLQTNQLVTKINRLLTPNVHSTSVPIGRCSPHTLQFKGGEVFMKNSATSKVIGKRTILFRFHDGCITTLQNVRHIPESRYNFIFLEPYIGKDSVSILKVILWKSLKRPMWSFKTNVLAMCICCEIQNLQFVDFNYSRLQKRRLWNNQRLQWFWAHMFSCTPKRDWN